MKSSDEYFSIATKYYERIRHYKAKNEKGLRQTVWIKWHLDFLDLDEFLELPDQTKWHFIGLLMLSVKTDNKIPKKLSILRKKLFTTSKINLELLEKKGLIIPNETYLNSCKEKESDSNSATKNLPTNYQNAFLEREEDKEEDYLHTHTGADEVTGEFLEHLQASRAYEMLDVRTEFERLIERRQGVMPSELDLMNWLRKAQPTRKSKTRNSASEKTTRAGGRYESIAEKLHEKRKKQTDHIT